ncbi:hypothetical protein I3842_06G009900 [Carya illinoinensis]|uniref:Retrovirus-related Pol polyprotein from transposon TNT 1-94-like beta-barrel domain-containing protein n=1 Tax=Carya illinoinensis TaxID=32201 RepID=A0A922ERZ2_CARIL|nr:hypothetical protein I3842_06G009900 [Carya illinoinensis]
MKLTHFFNKLKGMKVELADSFLLWQEMMKNAKSHAAFMVTIDKGKKKFFKSNSSNFRKIKKPGKPPQQASMSVPNGPKNEVFKGKCNFCHLFGHRRIDCRKFKAWLDKKGTRSLLVYFESNLIDVPLNTWWLDTGATIHITNSLQELRNRRRPIDTELVVNMDNGVKVKVEHIGTVRLILASKHVLELV